VVSQPVLRAAQRSRYYPALVLIAATGLRKGEALALSWDTNVVNLDEGWLKVRKTLGRVGTQLVFPEPKTDRSRRTVPISPAVVAMLRKHRATQKAERLRAGNQWQETGLVFTTELGRPVDPRNFLRVIEDAAEAAGVEGVRVHTLRIPRRSAGWRPACTSKPSPTCLGTRRSRLPAIFTATPATTRHARRSTGGAGRSDSEATAEISSSAGPRRLDRRIILSPFGHTRRLLG
jgi:hypothetical protein